MMVGPPDCLHDVEQAANISVGGLLMLSALAGVTVLVGKKALTTMLIVGSYWRNWG
jgi:hypothetical protein